MNTEIMNNIEEITEATTDMVADVTTKVTDNFGKGVAFGTGLGLLAAGLIKLAVTGIKKHKGKKYIEAEVVEVQDDFHEDDDSVL